MNPQEIKNIIDANRQEYCCFGIRAMMVNPVTGEHQIVEVDDIVANSYDWSDGDSTGEELNGTCALEIDIDADVEDIEAMLKSVDVYAWDAKQIVLLGSLDREYGNDKNEIIMTEAVVLATTEIN